MVSGMEKFSKQICSRKSLKVAQNITWTTDIHMDNNTFSKPTEVFYNLYDYFSIHKHKHHSSSSIACLTLCLLGNFSCLCCCLLTFFKINFFKKIISGTLSECQTVWIQFGPNLGPNCLQKISAEHKSRL